MNDTDKDKPDDEPELDSETVEDLDAEDAEVKGGVHGPPARPEDI